MRLFDFFLHEESGQGLVEYSLIIVLIAIVVIGGLILFGVEVNDLYNKSSNTIP